VKKVITFLFLLVFSFASVAFGADQVDWPDIYISTSGTGTGVGSELDPYADFDEVNYTTGGDNSVYDAIDGNSAVTINLQCNGTWNDTIVQIEGGKAGYSVTYQSYGTGAKPIIKKSYTWADWDNEAGDVWWTNFATPTVTGAELITNGDFETGVDGDWVYYENQATGDGTQSIVDNAGIAHAGDHCYMIDVDVAAGDDDTDIMIKSPRFAQTKGTVYKLVFWAKTSVNQTISPPQAMGYSYPGVKYGLDPADDIDLTNVWTEFVYYYEAIYTSTTHAMIRWRVGDLDVIEVIYLDDVSLKACVNSESALLMDIGIIIFNDGVNDAQGHKKATKAEVTVVGGGTQGDYWVDQDTYQVYLNSASDPDTYYSKVELCGNRVLMRIAGESYIDIDGIRFCNTGFNGIYTTNNGFNCGGSNQAVTKINVRNSDFVHIGGQWGTQGTATRSGNGITFWNDISDILVEYCYAYDCYDNAFTNQGTSGSQLRVRYQWNVIDKCEIAIATWLKTPGVNFTDIFILNNTITNTGYQPSHEDRPDGKRARSIQLGYTTCTGTIANAVVKNNLIYRANDDTNGFCYKQRTQWDNTNATFENNILWQDNATDGLIEVEGGSDYVRTELADYQSDEGMGVDCIVQDPLFKNPALGNFGLPPLSPARDNGSPKENYGK